MIKKNDIEYRIVLVLEIWKFQPIFFQAVID